MKNKIILVFFSVFFLILTVSIVSHFFIKSEPKWNEALLETTIQSSKDNYSQEALHYGSQNSAPLIVSLHQWSASYNDYDEISEIALENDWNYIRPNFRGPNDNPKACGSDLVINDIDDAIEYAVNNGNVDRNQIHIIGPSGGGHAALMHFMKSEMLINSYSSWVPITDLLAWYGQSEVRDNKYKDDILQCTNSDDILDIKEAKKRSPLHLETPIDKLEETRLYIFAGINDGYNGSVPISHSINFYNKIIEDLDLSEYSEVPIETAQEMLYTQQISENSNMNLGDRDVLYQKETQNISLTIFDGGHEILNKEAFRILWENYTDTN